MMGHLTRFSDLTIEDDRKEDITKEVGKWSFCAHDFSEDELVYAGYFMLNHALKMPELENWRLSEGMLEQADAFWSRS